MTKDLAEIKAGDSIFGTFPRERMNGWIENLNFISSQMGISSIDPETKDYIRAEKINEIINLIKALCNKSGQMEKIVGHDEEGNPEYETRSVTFTITGSAQVDAVIYASFMDSIRVNYNALVEWSNWYGD